MGSLWLKWLAFSLAALTSFAPAPTSAQTYLRCTPNQQAQWDAAWLDAVSLASAARNVLTSRTNEALVRRYFFAISPADRAMVELAFDYVISSPTVASTYILSCGDFQAGDPSSGIFPTIAATSTVCQDPLTNAYTVRFSGIPPATTGTTTNDIAGCAMLNADRTGSIQNAIWGTPAQLQAFCTETDFPLNHAAIGTHRRMYFRGWTFLHELFHSFSVGAMAGIMAQGPGDDMPYPGATDFTYDQESTGLLDPAQAARNADSYAHFAWEAFFAELCGQAAKAQSRKFNADDFVDWDAMESQGLVSKREYRPPQAVPRYAAPEPENLERRVATGSGPKARTGTTMTKPKTRRKKPGKGVGRKIKIRKCRGCRQVPKGPKGVQKAGKIKKTPLKKCKAREIYIPMVLVGKKINPKIKKGTCVPLPVVMAASKKPETTKPGTTKKTTGGEQTPPGKKQVGSKKTTAKKKPTGGK